MAEAPTLADLRHEEERLKMEEDAEVERKRHAATRLAFERGLQAEGHLRVESPPSQTRAASIRSKPVDDLSDMPETEASEPENGSRPSENNFVPARLPHFG
jgi:hypothetical protein